MADIVLNVAQVPQIPVKDQKMEGTQNLNIKQKHRRNCSASGTFDNVCVNKSVTFGEIYLFHGPFQKLYLFFFVAGNTQYLDTANSFENTNDNIGAIAIGLYNGMWAYDGW